mgnify:CR=1 FL=1
MPLYKSQQLKIYNSLSGEKEVFTPIHEGNVGMYVCGPTVYSNVHLGNLRTFMSFDVIFRYFQHLDYKVRYVRNITDVGHIVDDVDEGEDKIAKKARLEQLEPMEVVQRYTVDFHEILGAFNFLPPSIEPTATGHIIEQIEIIKKIIDTGIGYEANGSVYFDVEKFASENDYGKLSGRKIEDLISNTRTLDGQDEKRSGLDFAIWKKAQPEHIMRWPSPWSDGFPGWHMECTAMSCKYLGETFDIHGGGMDLTFPHHEAEMAQAQAAHGKPAVRYWMHNNMITLNGQKMGKSLGNAISLEQFFSGDHPLLEKAYSPMTIRFFMLQAHYRSTLDFSNEALQASEKGLERLMKAAAKIETLPISETSSVNISELKNNCFAAMADDMNSPIAMSYLFEGVKIINSVADGKSTVTSADRDALKSLFNAFVFDIFGLKADIQAETGNSEVLNEVIALLMKLRAEAKANKDWATSDKIRNELAAIGFDIKDGKDGVSWELKK